MIRYEKVNLDFDQKTVFYDFSLEIKRGEKAVLLGKSGLGKSSLFALILGFIRPQSGNIFFDGAIVDEYTVWNVRQRVSFIDQDVSIGNYKVRDWFAFISEIKANQVLEIGDQRIRELMDFFELSQDLFNKEVSELSGGERQRIAIIASVLLDREVFLLDEATSALDKNLKKKTADFFTGHKSWTVVSIAHDVIWLDNPFVKVFDLERSVWKR